MQSLQAGKLRVEVYPDRKKLGEAAAEALESFVCRRLQQKARLRMVFASAPSQNEFIDALVQRTAVDWSRIEVFHMDEYIGLPEDAPQLFSRYLVDSLFDRVKPAAVHLIDSTNEVGQECRRYKELLQQEPIDAVCLGIGENGHIAFNDPAVADFHDPALVKQVELDEVCRQQQVNDGCFPSLEAVPTQAITLTIPALFSGDALFCMVPGRTKRQAVTDTLTGSISEACPASILREHDNCRLYLDTESYDPVVQSRLS